MKLNKKDKANGQGDDETKIYNSYIRLIEFSTAAKSFFELDCRNENNES